MAMRKCEYEAIAWQYLTGQYINVIASRTHHNRNYLVKRSNWPAAQVWLAFGYPENRASGWEWILGSECRGVSCGFCDADAAPPAGKI